MFQRIISLAVWFNLTLMCNSLFQIKITAAHLSLNSPKHVTLRTSVVSRSQTAFSSMFRWKEKGSG